MSQVSIIDIEGNHPQIPTQFDADSGSAIPVGNVLEILGDTVANGTNAKPVFTTGSGNTITTEVQVGAAITGAPADVNDAGLVSFDDSMFTVSEFGFVQLIGGSDAIDSLTGDDGTPVFPDGAGNLNLVGTIVANGTNAKPLFFDGDVGSFTQELELQVATAAVSDPGNTTNAGIAFFDSDSFTVSSNGFVQLIGQGTAIDQINVDFSTVPGTDPVIPDTNGEITVTGSTVANATNANAPIATHSRASNTYAIELQVATEITGAPGDKFDAGICSFNDTQFTVDADGYVELVGGTDLPGIQTLTGDSGGAIGPDANGNIDILGGPGVTVVGTANTLTINSVEYTDQAGSTTVATDSGSFATNAITLTTPASMADGERLEFIATNGVLVIQLNGTQVAHLGTESTSAGGTITGSATGDAISLIYQASTDDLWALNSVGVWVLA